jgi:hypothetical protein
MANCASPSISGSGPINGQRMSRENKNVRANSTSSVECGHGAFARFPFLGVRADMGRATAKVDQ